MPFNKTGKAREALQAGAAAGLSLADRRILILVDGRRSLDELAAMLGMGILPSIELLLREGYIARSDAGDASAARATGLGGAVTGLVRATAEVVQARAEQIRAAAIATAPVPPGAGQASAPPTMVVAPATQHPQAHASHAPGTRRSLAACKMYMLDMLQLQRTPDAAELRVAIQCTTEPMPLVDALLRALRLIVATSNAGYGERVAQRLAEILPLEALPRMEAMRAERNVAPPSLSIVA